MKLKLKGGKQQFTLSANERSKLDQAQEIIDAIGTMPLEFREIAQAAGDNLEGLLQALDGVPFPVPMASGGSEM